ncbi:MAG TPA: hypothetical protein VL096_21275 [Pirellulaceae bacterium]|nr:hypothetical protein [Pirellulaceae bacterium]
MLTHITLAIGMFAVGADPTAVSPPRQVPAAFQNKEAIAADGALPGEADCGPEGHDCTWHGADGWSNYQFYGPQDFRKHFLISPRDMHQRMPFWNKERGYYYFRPYHVVHVLQQQERAVTWGGNADNPYDNRFLDKIHEECVADFKIREKAGVVEDLPQVPGNKPMTTPDGVEPEGKPPTPEDPLSPPPEGGARRPSSKKVAKFGFSKP